MSWAKDIVTLVQSVLTLTKDVERTNSEIKELRKDMSALTHSVHELAMQMQHDKEKTALVLDGYSREIDHIKEGNAAKFQVLTTLLDQKIDGFQSLIVSSKSKPTRTRTIPVASSLKKSTTEK